MRSVRSVVSMTVAPSTLVDGGDDLRAVLVARGVDGDVAQRVAAGERDEVDGADRAAGVADRAGDLAEHAGAMVDLDADGQRVLGGRGSGHEAADLR